MSLTPFSIKPCSYALSNERNSRITNLAPYEGIEELVSADTNYRICCLLICFLYLTLFPF